MTPIVRAVYWYYSTNFPPKVSNENTPPQSGHVQSKLRSALTCASLKGTRSIDRWLSKLLSKRQTDNSRVPIIWLLKWGKAIRKVYDLIHFSVQCYIVRSSEFHKLKWSYKSQTHRIIRLTAFPLWAGWSVSPHDDSDSKMTINDINEEILPAFEMT